MTMGEIIKDLRIKSGMTMDELGEKLGVQKSAVRKWEKGAVENIKRTTIQNMADIFDVDPCYLMGWETTHNQDCKLQKECNLIEALQAEYGSDAVKLLQNFMELNAVGQQKALETVSDLTELPKYTEKEKTGLKHA